MSAHRGEPRQSEPGLTTKFNIMRYTLCPRITLAVDGIEFSALVDTGAGRSIISVSVVELLNGKYTINNSEEVEFYDASNNKMNSRGSILLKVRSRLYYGARICNNEKNFEKLHIGNGRYRKA